MKLAMTSLTVVTAVALGSLFAAAPAEASYKICNKTKTSVDAAFGYKKDGDWVAEGWWHIEPGKCKTVYGGDLESQKYYFYADTADGDGQWGGDYTFCTLEKCASRSRIAASGMPARWATLMIAIARSTPRA